MKVPGTSPRKVTNKPGGETLCTFPKPMLWGLLSLQNDDAVSDLYFKVGCGPDERVTADDFEYRIGPRGFIDLDMVEPGDVKVFTSAAAGISVPWHAGWV